MPEPIEARYRKLSDQRIRFDSQLIHFREEQSRLESEFEAKLAELKTKYGINSVEELKAQIQTLQQSIDATLSQMESALGSVPINE